MKSKLDNALEILRRHGLKVFLQYSARKTIQSIWGKNSYKRIFLFELSTPKPAPDSIEHARNHVFRFATREDLEDLRKDAKWDILDADIAAFKKGDRCLLQEDGEKLVGYAWLASSSLVEVGWGFHINMPNDTVYNYKGFTAEEYRGKGFQPLRHLKLLEHVRETGQKRLFGYVDHLNLRSLRGVRKSGYRQVGVLRCTKLQGKFRFSLKVDNDNWGLERRT